MSATASASTPELTQEQAAAEHEYDPMPPIQRVWVSYSAK